MNLPKQEPIFFDTDNLACFLWVDNRAILPLLFPGRIFVSEQVEKEVIKVPYLRSRFEILQTHGAIKSISIEMDTPEEEEYYKLIDTSDRSKKIIGAGEASCMVLAKFRNGIIASNNTIDIHDYCVANNIKQIKTGDILQLACKKKFITEEDCEKLWQEMLAAGRWLTAPTYKEYIKNNPCVDFL